MVVGLSLRHLHLLHELHQLPPAQRAPHDAAACDAGLASFVRHLAASPAVAEAVLRAPQAAAGWRRAFAPAMPALLALVAPRAATLAEWLAPQPAAPPPPPPPPPPPTMRSRLSAPTSSG